MVKNGATGKPDNPGQFAYLDELHLGGIERRIAARKAAGFDEEDDTESK